MGDLSTIDETKPDNSELARLGAGRIRDIELATKTSFGVEHSLVGYHKFLVGANSDRPAPGNPGRIFINTFRGRMERDDGAAWRGLQNNLGLVTSASTPVVLTSNFQTILSQSLDVPSFTTIAAFASLVILPSVNAVWEAELTVDGVVMTGSDSVVGSSISQLTTQIIFGMSTGLVEGVRSVAFQAKMQAGTGTVSARSLVVMAF